MKLNKLEKPSLETNQIILKDKSLKTGLLNFRDAFKMSPEFANFA